MDDHAKKLLEATDRAIKMYADLTTRAIQIRVKFIESTNEQEMLYAAFLPSMLKVGDVERKQYKEAASRELAEINESRVVKITQFNNARSALLGKYISDDQSDSAGYTDATCELIGLIMIEMEVVTSGVEQMTARLNHLTAIQHSPPPMEKNLPWWKRFWNRFQL